MVDLGVIAFVHIPTDWCHKPSLCSETGQIT